MPQLHDAAAVVLLDRAVDRQLGRVGEADDLPDRPGLVHGPGVEADLEDGRVRTALLQRLADAVGVVQGLGGPGRRGEFRPPGDPAVGDGRRRAVDGGGRHVPRVAALGQEHDDQGDERDEDAGEEQGDRLHTASRRAGLPPAACAGHGIPSRGRRRRCFPAGGRAAIGRAVAAPGGDCHSSSIHG